MAQNKNLKQEITEVARKYVNYVRDQGITVSEAYLFGSWAKGNAKKDSDIDVCVVSEQFGRDDIDELQRLLHLTRKVDLRIEPISLTPEDLANHYSTLSAEIRKYGIRIV